MSYQKYYVPEQSKYPIYLAIALFLLVMGAAGTINDLGKTESNSAYILYLGLAAFGATLYFWFRAVIRESILLVLIVLNFSNLLFSAWLGLFFQK